MEYIAREHSLLFRTDTRTTDNELMQPGPQDPTPRAVQWDDTWAARFPNESHEECLVTISNDRTTITCRDMHCTRCGRRAHSVGHRDCGQPE